ncbi:MAG: zinc ribbon domain-containing protein [Coriobacteriia bacterium]|nr:zinc ribbon domain-containing protein [Coriobacteriia bacterium]
MQRPSLRTAFALVGALVLLSGIGLLLTSVARDSAIFSDAVGWTIPLVAGASVGLLSWLLLVGVGVHEPESPKSTRCVSCGTQIFEEWRLCPYCGGSQESVAVDANKRVGAGESASRVA